MNQLTRRAKQVNRSATWWQQIEKGYKAAGEGQEVPVRPQPEMLAKMADVVGITPRQLKVLGHEDEAERLESLIAARKKAARATADPPPTASKETPTLVTESPQYEPREWRDLPFTVRDVLNEGDIVDFDLAFPHESEDIAVVTLVVKREHEEPRNAAQRRAALKALAKWGDITEAAHSIWEWDTEEVGTEWLSGEFAEILQAKGGSGYADPRPVTGFVCGPDDFLPPDETGS